MPDKTGIPEIEDARNEYPEAKAFAYLTNLATIYFTEPVKLIKK